MSENPREIKPFELKADKSKLYIDLLRFILLKILPDEAKSLLAELQKVSHDRWTAIESGDASKAESLERTEDELVQKILDLAPNK